MSHSPDITSFSEHLSHLREHIDRVQQTDRPLLVTTGGKAEAVVLSPKAYDELADRADLPETLAMIERSEADIKAGRVRDAGDSLRDIARKHGLPFDR